MPVFGVYCKYKCGTRLTNMNMLTHEALCNKNNSRGKIYNGFLIRTEVTPFCIVQTARPFSTEVESLTPVTVMSHMKQHLNNPTTKRRKIKNNHYF